MAAIFVILIQFMFYTEVLNNICPGNIVPVCTNSSKTYTQMDIPVNDSMGNGCMCDVTLVKASSTGNNSVRVTSEERLTGCGYEVVNYKTTNNDSWSCKQATFYYRLSLNKSFQLTFTRHSTASTGFCLYLTNVIYNISQDIGFTITCSSIHATSITTDMSRTPVTPIGGSTKEVKGTPKEELSRTPVTPIGGSTKEVKGTPKEELSETVIIGVAAGGVCVLLILVMVVVICLVKRRKNKNYDKPSPKQTGENCCENIHHEEPASMEHNLHVSTGNTNSSDRDSKGNKPSTDMIYLENDMYVSYDTVTTAAKSSPCRQGDVSVHTVPNHSCPSKRSPSSPDYTDIDDFPGQKQDKLQEQSTSNTTKDFVVDKNQNVNNVYAVVNKKTKSKPTDASPGKSKTPIDEIPSQTFSVVQSPNPNNVYAVVNKRPKVANKTPYPTKPVKPVKPLAASKPKI